MVWCVCSIKEQKEKLREAKLRALTGEAADHDEDGPHKQFGEGEDDEEDDDLSDVSR